MDEVANVPVRYSRCKLDEVDQGTNGTRNRKPRIASGLAAVQLIPQCHQVVVEAGDGGEGSPPRWVKTAAGASFSPSRSQVPYIER